MHSKIFLWINSCNMTAILAAGGVSREFHSFQCTIHLIQFAPLVESFDAFNEPFLRFPLIASRSYRKHSLSLIARSGTDSALDIGIGK